MHPCLCSFGPRPLVAPGSTPRSVARSGIRSRPGARQGLGPIVFLPTTKQIESALNSPTSIYRLYTQFPFCLVTITCVNSKRSEEACVEEVQYFS